MRPIEALGERWVLCQWPSRAAWLNLTSRPVRVVSLFPKQLLGRSGSTEWRQWCTCWLSFVAVAHPYTLRAEFVPGDGEGKIGMGYNIFLDVNYRHSLYLAWNWVKLNERGGSFAEAWTLRSLFLDLDLLRPI